MDGPTPVAEVASSCPRCKATLTGEGNCCNRCGFTLVGTHVYDPKHFFWLALLLSAMVPIYLSAMNWGRIGRTRTKWLWLGFGVLGFVLVVASLYLLPNLGNFTGRFLGYFINLPISLALREQQRPLYAAARRLGAKRGSLLKGALAGVGLGLAAYALATGALIARSQFVYHRAQAFLARGDYTKAATMFEAIIRQEPEEDSAIFNLALCHYRLQNWPEAARGFEQYLRLNGTDATCWALLSHVRSAQGLHEEADRSRTRAEELEPGIFERLFGPQDVPEEQGKSVPPEHL